MTKFIKLSERRNAGRVEDRYFNVANITLIYTDGANETIVQTVDGYGHTVKEDLETVLKKIEIVGE